MTLQDHNTAVNFQRTMPTEIANIYARALPNEFTCEFKSDAVRDFEDYVLKHPNMRGALDFLHRQLIPSMDTTLLAKLSGRCR